MTGEATSLTYKVVEGWDKLPEGWKYTQVAGVAVDSKDRVYVFNRGKHPVIVFDRDGNFLTSWGEGVFGRAHGIYISPDDSIYCADDGDHTIRKFTTEGELQLTIGNPGLTLYGSPFNRPTDAAISPSGDIYVSDGYGNSMVHKFTSRGNFILSWGMYGEGPGQFIIPHGIWVHSDGRVFVADRQNHRIQIFTPQGELIDQWTGFRQPCTIYMDKENKVYVPELQARMSVLSIEGELLARWGGDRARAKEPGQFYAPHCAWADSHGDLYVGEVLEGQRIQKFVKED